MTTGELDVAVKRLARTIQQKFSPPQFVPGCEVKSIADIDEYATNNGWIEAICGEHNQQRVRYKAFPASVQVGDLLDVVYYPQHGFFEVHGGGGATTTGVDNAKVSKVFEPDLSASALSADNSGDITVSGNLIMSGTVKAIEGTGSNKPDLGDAADSTKKWGSIYIGDGEQLHANGEFTFTTLDAWSLKSTPGTWIRFDGASTAYGIVPQNTTIPDLGASAAANRFGSLYLTGGETIDIDGNLNIQGGSGAEILVNDDQVDVDLKVRGTNQNNLFFIDAGNDRIGIHTGNPSHTIHGAESYSASAPHSLAQFSQNWGPTTTTGNVFPVVMTLAPTYSTTHSPSGGFLTSFRLFAEVDNSGVLPIRNIDIRSTNSGAGTLAYIQELRIRTIQNTGGGAVTEHYSIYLENQTVAGTNYGIFQLGSGVINRLTGKLTVGGSTNPTAQLRVDQSSTTAAVPVLHLNQADVSEQMIDFNTTIGVGNAIEAVGAKTLTTTHFIKVTLPGSLTRYIPVGTIA